LEFKNEIKCEFVIGGGFVALLEYLKLIGIFNPLALELDIYSLEHHLCKM